MTDKVRIDTLRADLLDANNETFLARQAGIRIECQELPA
ncbi:diaminobutyrate--2-oxoglutarate aminotransferase [Klebsiella pneumoniae]|uniref:Diaminobutyrate--2-oxoglutarate aminotransferase n=1 Tax=Klebsiella pneumoniae TaxID=573 RepID=A0A377X8T4_KLEPN|nr:diaminobutyrate--2-oxoglutarate aminotransferase [Klebsiella pneumoniae]